MTIIDPNSTSTRFYQDTSQLHQLKGKAALSESAEEFEAIFLQTVLKNMREASVSFVDENNPLFSKQTRFYQQMMDGQLSQQIAANTDLGIADAIERQMTPEAMTQTSRLPLKDDELTVANDSYPSSATETSTGVAMRQPLTMISGGAFHK